MLTHTTTGRHFTIDSRADGGVPCPKCRADAHQHCITGRDFNNHVIRMPGNTVHTERVRKAGHSVYTEVLPIHKARIPKGAFAELRRLQK